MTLDDKRWAQFASELKFRQLDIARKQAEVWRAGLGALTALLTAILVLKGRGNVSDLTRPYQALCVGLLALALTLLMAATLWVNRALAGPSGRNVRLSGNSVKRWTEREVDKISLALRWVPWFAAAGVLAVAAAVGVTWLAPVQGATAGLVRVVGTSGQECGQYLGETATQLILHPSTGPVTTVPLAEVTSVTPVATCP